MDPKQSGPFSIRISVVDVDEQFKVPSGAGVGYTLLDTGSQF